MILANLIHYTDTNSVEATWVDDAGRQVRCHSYADVQMDMLEADLGDDLMRFSGLIASVRANLRPTLAPTPAQIRAAAKASRAEAVAAIKVTTQAGNIFDGDELSQGRMARAIIALNATGTPSVNWVLTDNSVIAASAAELSEALALAGAAQAALWVI